MASNGSESPKSQSLNKNALAFVQNLVTSTIRNSLGTDQVINEQLNDFSLKNKKQKSEQQITQNKSARTCKIW
jgi:hypothetical protein